MLRVRPGETMSMRAFGEQHETSAHFVATHRRPVANSMVLEGVEARVGFEPTNGGFADLVGFAILLIRFARYPASGIAVCQRSTPKSPHLPEG